LVLLRSYTNQHDNWPGAIVQVGFRETLND
jgi:hypothetical protein